MMEDVFLIRRPKMRMVGQDARVDDRQVISSPLASNDRSAASALIVETERLIWPRTGKSGHKQ